MKNDYETLQKSNLCMVSGKDGSPQSYRTSSRYLSRSLQFVMMLSLLLCGLLGTAQTVLINPAAEGGFENGATFASNGWTVSNGANNQWFVGTVAASGALTGNVAYVSSSATGATHAYNTSNASSNYFYRDVTVPAGHTKIVLQFNWYGQGESNWDMWQVFAAPTTVTPTGGTTYPGSGASNIPAGLEGAVFVGNGHLQATPQTATLLVPSSFAGTTFRLIFHWKSDTLSGTQPPAAIDNISLTSGMPGTYISIASGNYGAPSTWDANWVPTAIDNVVVSAGHTVTVDATGHNSGDLAVNGTLAYSVPAASFTVNGNLNVNSGGAVNVYNGTTGKSLFIRGNLTNNGTVDASVGATTAGNLTFNGTSVQTISGTGTFVNNKIRNLVFSNTSTAIPNINWLFNNISVEYTLNIANAKINLGGNTLIYGSSTSLTGDTFTFTNGGFMPGGKFSRWWSGTQTGYTTSAPTSIPTGAAGRYPFFTPDGQQRIFYLGRTTPSAGGQYAVVYNDASTMTSGLSVADGAYTVTDRWNGNFVVTTEGTTPAAASNWVTIFAPGAFNINNTNTRIMGQNAAISGTHVAGTTLPSGQRSGVSTADLTSATGLYLGISNADIPHMPIANGNWDNAAIWNKGTVPGCTDFVNIATGYNVTVGSAGNQARSLIVSTGATLTMASGDLTVGCTLFNNPFVNNGTFTITGGTLNVNGSMTHNSGSTFNQSGGSIIIDGNDAGVTANSVASGALLQLNTNLINLTAGTITIVDPHANTTATNTLAYNNSTAHANISAAHTIIFGNGTSTDVGGNATAGFRINTFVGSNRLTLGSIVVNGNAASTANRHVAFNTSVGVNGTITVNTGSEFRDGGNTAYVSGNIVNNGTYVTTGTLHLGSFVNATVAANTVAQTISGTGTFANSTSTVSANLTSLNINNTGGVTMNVPLSLSGTFTLTAGKLNTTDTNILTVGTATAAATINGGSDTSFVNGPLRRTVATGNANTNFIVFPVGKTTYNPIWLAPATTAVSVFKAEAFDSNTGTANASIINLTANRRWEAPLISGTITSMNVRVGDAALINTNIPVMAPSASGEYTASFGSVATYTAGTPNTTQSNTATTAYTGFISYAVSNACSGVPAPGNTIASATNICAGTTVNLSVQTVTPGSGVTYQWQSSVNGTDFTDIATATNATYVTTPVASLYYRLKVTCATGPDTAYSTPVQVSFPSSVASVAPATRCGVGSITLGATPSAGATTYWYSSATGGTALTTGNSFTTNVTATTDFYVSAGQPTPGTNAAIGTGSTTSSTYSNPLYSAWSNNHTQHLITAQELLNAGLNAGNINSIALDVTSAGSLPMIDLSIKIGTSSAVSMTEFTSNAGFATVYTNASYMPTVGVNTFTFTTPFYWDGVSNIVVEFCHGNSASTATMSRTVKADPTSYVSTVKYHFSAATAAGTVCGTTTGSNLASYSVRPQFIFNGVASCFSPRQVVTATVSAPPALTLSTGAAAICTGQSTATVTLTAGATDYDSYTWTPSTGVSGSAATGWTFNPASTTTYTLNATQSTGSMCVAVPATITVTVNPTPTALTVATPAPVCIDNVATLTATGGLVPVNSTLGTGTSVNGTTSYPSPYSNYYGGTKHQMLIRASELTALGYVSGTSITKIAFNVAAVGSTFTGTLNNFTIDMGHTATNVLNSTSFVGGLSNVLPAGTVAIPTTGLPAVVTHTLAVPFVWNGTDNIVIQTSYSNANSGTTTDFVQVTNTDAGFVSTNWYRADSVSASDILNAATPSSSSASRPNMIITAMRPATTTWSPVTNLYTDAAATTPYVAGTNARTVYAKSATAGNTTYTVTSSTPAGCSVSQTVDVSVVNCAIDFANLQSPATASIYTCNSQVVTGQVFKAGVTEAAGAAAGMKAWVGVSATNSDPSTWTEANWYLATFSTQVGNNDEYTYTVTGLPAGTYYYATRYQYLTGAYIYGGLAGVWNGTTSTSGTLTVNSVAAPATTNATFCNAAPTVADLASYATGTALKWYDVATGGTALANTTTLVAGTYYVSQTINGCEGPRGTVTVTLNTTAAPSTTNAAFCNAAPTVAELAAYATGTDLKWYDVATGGTQLANTTALVAGNYFVSQTINGCEGPRATVAVTLNTTAAPAVTNATFCNAAPTVADLASYATGTALKWYDAATGGTQLANTTALVAGNYYVSQTINGCEGPRATVAVTLNTTAAPAVTNATFCNAAPTVADLAAYATGTDLKWYDVATGGTQLANTTALVAGNYYVSQTINGCEGPRATVAVTLNTTAAPVVSDLTFCNAAPTVADIITATTGTAVKVYDAATGGTELASTTTLVAGNYFVSQTINGCEGPRATVAVTLNTTAAPVADAAQTFCAGATVADIEVTTGTAVQWYSTVTGDTPIAATTALVNGTTYYVSQTINGCESARTGVTATITTVAVDDMADQVVCDSYTLPALTNGNYFGGANGTGTAYTAGDVISSDMTMYIFNQVGECTAETSFTIDVNVVAAPAGDAIQAIEVTNLADATIEDLEVTVTGTLTWYATEADALAGVNAIAPGTQLVNGEDYFAVQTIGTCTSAPFEVTVTVTLGKDDFAIQNIKVYPNPVVEKLVISYSSNITLVEVYDLLGKRVIVEQPNTTTAEINMGRLEAATYIVKVTADGMTKDVKVVKRN